MTAIIANIAADRNGFAVVVAARVAGGLHLPLLPHLLPYPGIGPAGHAQIKGM